MVVGRNLLDSNSRHRRRKTAHTQSRHRLANEHVAEIISRTASPNAQARFYNSRFATTTVDATIPDYAFYDLLRRGKQPGYKLGALFAKRVEHVFAIWILGRGVTVSLAEAGAANNANDPRNITDAVLDDFINANHALLMTVIEDKIGLGDQYIIVNIDGTLSVPSPDTVEVVRDELDYRTVIAVKVTTKLTKITLIDEYRADERLLTIRRVVNGKMVESVERFANLIGRIPVVHLAYGRSGNETNGHSIHEDLLKLYDQYDDVIHKQLDGAKLLGNPILAFTGLEDLSAVIDANKPATPATYVDQDGAEVTRPELNIDSSSIMLIGKGGDGKFLAPPTGFTADTQQALKTLFLLLLDRTGIPEFIWGNELSSARASSDTQMMQWAHDIEGLQKGEESWLLPLCEIWLATTALTDSTVVVDALQAMWPPVLDENQELKLKSIELARVNNLLTNKTTLELLRLVDDAETETAAAQVEAATRAEQTQARMDAQAVPVIGAERAVGEIEAAALVAGAIRIVAGDYDAR